MLVVEGYQLTDLPLMEVSSNSLYRRWGNQSFGYDGIVHFFSHDLIAGLAYYVVGKI